MIGVDFSGHNDEGYRVGMGVEKWLQFRTTSKLSDPSELYDDELISSYY